MSAPAAMLLYHLAIGYACVGGVVALAALAAGLRTAPQRMFLGALIGTGCWALTGWREPHGAVVEATQWALAVAAIGGSFLVPYARAKAEGLGIKGDVGIGSRAERVVVITAGLVLAPWGVLPWAIGVLAVTAWFTVLQRILHVRRELRSSVS